MSRILSTADVARRCGVTRRTVARWVDAGVLPATYTTGGHRRIREDDLVDFLDSRRSLMALDRLSPGLRVLVLSGRPETVGLFSVVADGLDPDITVRGAAPDLLGGLALAEHRPHLIVIDRQVDPARPDPGQPDLVASLRRAPLTRHAYIAAIGGADGADRTLSRPLISEAVRDAILAARDHREQA